MGRFTRPFFVIVLWLAVSVQSATAQSYPQDRDPYVNDYADLLTPTQEQEIATKLADLRKNRDIEMTVLTITRRSDYGQTVTNEVFATNLFNRWGIGDRNRNDGVLFLVSRYDRDMRIEVGSGYGRTKDDALKKSLIASSSQSSVLTPMTQASSKASITPFVKWQAFGLISMMPTNLPAGGLIYASGPEASSSQFSRPSVGLSGAPITPPSVAHLGVALLTDLGCRVFLMNSSTST